MKKFTFSAYFSGASPRDEVFTITGEDREEAEEKIAKEIRQSMQKPENIFTLSSGEKAQYSTFRGLTLKETEYL
jgi:(p)ppGpp synthase/HD superfamily hydrolase